MMASTVRLLLVALMLAATGPAAAHAAVATRMDVTGNPLQRLAAAGLAEVALVGSTSGSQDGRQFVFLGLSNAGEHPLLVSGTLKLADGWGVVVQDLRWSGAELPPLGSLSHAVPLAREPLARGDYRAT